MTFQHEHMLTIGVDLGGTNLRIAAYAPQSGILDSIVLRTRLEAGPEAVVDDMCAAIAELLERHTPTRPLLGIAIGSPGPLELPAGRLHHPPNLPGWDGFGLLDAVEQRLGRKVILESDANLAAIAEHALGLGQSLGIDSLCMLTLGTGVGNGIVLNGRLWHGASGMGGEAGHITVEPNGPVCGCGSRGCLESCASATAVVRSAVELIEQGKAPGLALLCAEEPLTAERLAAAASDGDPAAKSIFAATGRYLGLCLADLVNVLNLPLYILGGGLANSWDLLAPELFAELESRSYVYALTAPGRVASHGMPQGGTQILPAKLGADAGLLGACILPHYSAVPQDSPSSSTPVNLPCG